MEVGIKRGSRGQADNKGATSKKAPTVAAQRRHYVNIHWSNATHNSHLAIKHHYNTYNRLNCFDFIKNRAYAKNMFVTDSVLCMQEIATRCLTDFEPVVSREMCCCEDRTPEKLGEQ